MRNLIYYIALLSPVGVCSLCMHAVQTVQISLQKKDISSYKSCVWYPNRSAMKLTVEHWPSK